MKFLLDTNAVSALLKGHSRFSARLREHQPADIGIPAIVAHELFFGAYKGQRTQQTLARLDGVLLETVDFDREDARAAGEIRATLSRAGTPIGPYDALIAGQALARGLTLITHNQREFQRIPGLQVEDWE